MAVTAPTLSASDRDEAIAFLRDVVAIESIWGNERSLAEFLAQRFEAWGFGDLRLIEAAPNRPTVTARVRGTGGGRTLVLTGHLDIYELSKDWTLDPFAGIVRDGRMYGAGIADQKAGTAAACFAARLLKEGGVPLRGDVVVMGVSAHFEGGVGARAALRAGVGGDGALTTEPSQMRVGIAHRGTAYLRITTYGRQAHTVAKEMGINAVEKMVPIIEGLKRLQFRYEPHPVLTGAPILNIGTIRGGTKHNQVPDRCEITVDIRILPSQSPEGVKAEVEGMIAALAQRDSDLRASVEFLEYWLSGPRYPTETPPDDPIVQAVTAGYRAATGGPPQLVGLPYWTDMAVFKEFGIPAVNCGPGGPPYNWADEYVALDEYLDAIRIYAATALAFCNGTP